MRCGSRHQSQVRGLLTQFPNHGGEIRVRPELSRVHDEIGRVLDLPTQGAESLAQEPPQPCARRSMPRRLRDREPEPAVPCHATRRNQQEMRPGSLPAFAHHATEVALVLQPILPTEASLRNVQRLRRGRAERTGHVQRVDTDRRRRPLARRRLMTARPFLVAMRARKPCVRMRLVLLGFRSPFFTTLPPKSPAGGQSGRGRYLTAFATQGQCTPARSHPFARLPCHGSGQLPRSAGDHRQEPASGR
jgi:hypothetical protein